MTFALTMRPAATRLWARTTTAVGVRCFAVSKDVALANAELDKKRQELEDEKSPAQREMEAMNKASPHMVFGNTSHLPAPKLPEDPAEITALDPAHLRDAVLPDGRARLVHIRQDHSKVGQSPTNEEKTWLISFQDEGETSETWDNPLMGWVSGADPMASNMQLQMSFRTAGDAVYFAKKRGWQFVVEEPILRKPRDDGAQYQDNFLPQAVASSVRRDRTQCKHWERPKAGASHYFRPLKYHGDGTTDQYGPNPKDDIAPDKEGYYKMR